MLTRVIAMACFATFATMGVAYAQADGPADQPRADYDGQSYVDSQGCVFLKAGYGGTATWVPRVGPDRKPVCGQTPTNALLHVTDAAASKTPSSPTARAKHARAKASHHAAPHVPVLIGCPVSVPVARRYATTDGGSVVVCTATNGSLTGARAPIYPAGSGVGASLSQDRYAGATIPLPQTRTAPLTDDFALPAGYARAGDPGRFNPARGKGTATGQALQDKTWSRATPAVAVSAPTKTAPAKPTAAKPTLSKSQLASAQPQPVAKAAASTRGAYVQVGAFGEPANATGASARIAALGLPVTTSAFTRKGRVLQVIYAGPFSSAAEAQSALTAVRNHGFTDAYLR